jgi:hypothetical protein
VSWLPVPAQVRSVSITGLKAGHQYGAVIAPFTAMGFGALSTVDVPTGPSSPPQAALVPWISAAPVTDGIAVTWGPLLELGRPTRDVAVLLVHNGVPFAARAVGATEPVAIVPSDCRGDIDVYVVARATDGTYGPVAGPERVHIPDLVGDLGMALGC